ncbi:MAG: hypothetical protein PHP39_01480 [Oscillospiraceae bacterium]|nr:hypothetical protein [Oscillospiraceae bacterium]
MKHNPYKFIALLMMFGLALLVGCSHNRTVGTSNETSWHIEDAEPVYVTKWPENNFTALIVKPDNGEIDYIRDFSADGRYEIVLKRISMDESAAYIEELKNQGYSEIASEGNNVSVGTLLQKANTTLSIAYSGTVFNILITVDNRA